MTQQIDKKEGRILYAKVSAELANQCDEAVSSGRYVTISELIRVALRRELRRVGV